MRPGHWRWIRNNYFRCAIVRQKNVLILNEPYYLLVSGAGSIELPIFSDANTDDEYETSTPGSPEQETVLPKATESNRPHIQNVFSTSTSQQQPSEDNIW